LNNRRRANGSPDARTLVEVDRDTLSRMLSIPSGRDAAARTAFSAKPCAPCWRARQGRRGHGVDGQCVAAGLMKTLAAFAIHPNWRPIPALR
jgi:hypothetical protein